MDNTQTFNESFKLIKMRFIGKLNIWLPTFIELEKGLQQGIKVIENLEDIRMQMHKLAGSAKTFGFAELNGYAADAERILDKIIAGASLETQSSSLEETLKIFLSEVEKITSSQDLEHQTDKSNNIVVKKLKNRQFDYHVLVADDDELVRDLLKFGLSKAKCKITQAENGTKILEHLSWVKQNHTFEKIDLIILDVNMPDMSGFDILKKIKSDDDLKNIPVIMLTRRDEDESLIKGITYGALDYITKPFEISELVDRIMSTLQRHKTKILIADDDELICELLYQRFYRMGYTVLIAHNGVDALSIMNTNKPDVCILDIMMPSMDGLAVLKQAKETPDIAEMPIVILTAKKQQENILEGLKSGAHDYVTKPFDLEEVAIRVFGILQRRKKA
ncbi:MAG: response regulator transcription factor [Alphaproteobacteria bacterium]